MTFRVGQKVACIVHMPLEKRRPDGIYAEKDCVYTVRGFCPSSDGRTIIYLAEIRNPPMMCEAFGLIEFGFNAKYFRPVVERKTDIGFAHEILRKATKRAPARAPSLFLTSNK